MFQRRDIGSGVLAARPGPDRAGAGLRGPLGLAWRLQRASVIGWTAGLFLMGLAYGSIGDDVGDLVGDSETSQDVFLQGAADLVDGFYATSILMLALIACGFAISSALRPRGEEDGGPGRVAAGDRPAPARLAARPRRGDRARAPLVVLAASGLGLGLGYALVTGDGGAVRPAPAAAAVVRRAGAGAVRRWPGCSWA